MEDFTAIFDETFKHRRCPYCGSVDVEFFGGAYDYKEDFESGIILEEFDSDEYGKCKCGAEYYKPKVVYSRGGLQLNPEFDLENLWTAPDK
jgi:hypothetical protein